MGSSFSVLNDTNEPIWVSHGVCKAALYGSIGCVLSLVSFGAGNAMLTVGAVDITASSLNVSTFESERVTFATFVKAKGEAATVGGLTAEAWSKLSTVSGLLEFGPASAELLQGDKRDRVLSEQKKLRKILKYYTKVGPGGRYTANGTLSLVRTAYVIYDNGKLATHNCWTGPTAGSDYEYLVTMYF